MLCCGGDFLGSDRVQAGPEPSWVIDCAPRVSQALSPLVVIADLRCAEVDLFMKMLEDGCCGQRLRDLRPTKSQWPLLLCTHVHALTVT